MILGWSDFCQASKSGWCVLCVRVRALELDPAVLPLLLNGLVQMQVLYFMLHYFFHIVWPFVNWRWIARRFPPRSAERTNLQDNRETSFLSVTFITFAQQRIKFWHCSWLLAAHRSAVWEDVLLCAAPLWHRNQRDSFGGRMCPGRVSVSLLNDCWCDLGGKEHLGCPETGDDCPNFILEVGSGSVLCVAWNSSV